MHSIRIKHCFYEFHVLSDNDERTHIVSFEDILQKPILICYSCTIFFDDYKLRQMLGVHGVWTIDEYLTSRVVTITQNYIV